MAGEKARAKNRILPGIFPERYRLTCWLGVVSGLLVVALAATERLLPLNIRGIPPLEGVLNGLAGSVFVIYILTFLILLVLCVRWAVRTVSPRVGSKGTAPWLPLAVQVLALVVYVAIPTRVGFAPNRRAYVRVAEMVAAGDLPHGEKASTPLPPEYKRLTLTGEILVFAKEGAPTVYFLVGRQIGGCQHWLVYAANGRRPVLQRATGGSGSKVAVKKIEERWYDMFVY